MKWGIHCCDLDKECRSFGHPHRVYFSTPWGQLIIGLTPDSWTQAWLPGLGYQRWWAPIVWHPSRGEK